MVKKTTSSKKTKKTKKTKVENCPPAIAMGVKTTAEVKPIKRPRGQGPRKLMKKIPKVKKRKGRTKKWVDLDPIDDTKPKRPIHLPWTVKSRRILNEQKDRMIRRKRLSTSTRKRLCRQQNNEEFQQKVAEINAERKFKRLRRRLHDLFTHD